MSKVTVLGAGVSGRSIALLASRLGSCVFVSDGGEIRDETRALLTDGGIAFESGGHTDRALDCDVIVVSSGFPPSSEIIHRARDRGVRVMGELDFVMPHLRGRVIGVTGSNGKTTTTSLTAHLLKSLGYKTAAAGNIGNPISDIAGLDLDYIIVEMSSFQLHWASSLRLAGAVVTNLAPDHIDWHGSYENYVRAKASILSFVETDGFAITQASDAEALGECRGRTYRVFWERPAGVHWICLSQSDKSCRIGERRLFGFEETNLMGTHNMENAAMSMACVELLGCDADSARKGLGDYEAPPHRCSLVLSSGGVRYVDDSKGTNIAATAAALSSIEGSKIIILGGRGKGEDYSRLADPLKKHARWAVIMGEASAEMASALDYAGYDRYALAVDMEEAVAKASELAEPGDAVLLSPACTSWDMYKNYNERGDHFARLVRELHETA
jgi:UDP-N-acetylmuramoylalanine--D-glutamate ligase